MWKKHPNWSNTLASMCNGVWIISPMSTQSYIQYTRAISTRFDGLEDLFFSKLNAIFEIFCTGYPLPHIKRFLPSANFNRLTANAVQFLWNSYHGNQEFSDGSPCLTSFVFTTQSFCASFTESWVGFSRRSEACCKEFLTVLQVTPHSGVNCLGCWNMIVLSQKIVGISVPPLHHFDD